MKPAAGPAKSTREASGGHTGGKGRFEVSLADFSDVIVNMSRLLFELARISSFRNSHLGLAEWVALSFLADQGAMSNQQLGRVLGVSPQRAEQLKSSLRDAGYVSVRQSPEDARRNSITITHRGQAQLENLNHQLEPLIVLALKGRENTFVAMKRHLKILMRIIQLSRE